ncbi:MAG: hypothetical protein ABI193_04745, partial [Minicystis sp.]
MTNKETTDSWVSMIDILESKFKERALFLETVLRTNMVKTTSTAQTAPKLRSLADILMEDTWRTTLLKSIDNYQLSACEKEQGKDTRNKSVIGQVNAGMPGEDWASASTPGSNARPGGFHASNEIDRFASQHVIYRVVQYALNTTIMEPTPPVIDTCIDNWKEWTQHELLSFADATIIEILAKQRLGGRASLEAYNDSLRTARGIHFPPAPTEESVSSPNDGSAKEKQDYRDSLVPARVNLNQFLIS